MRLDIKEGQRFNKLTVVKELPTKRLPSGQTNRVFLCSCDCGRSKEVRLVHLSRGRIKSCGCLVVGVKLKTDQEHYIRKVWRSIKYRTDPKYFESHLYYDKGVRVSDEWKNDFKSFLDWSIKNGLKKGTHIDRIDGFGNYSSDNCRVVTPRENANNRIDTNWVIYNGEKKALKLLLYNLGKYDNYAAIRSRIKRGWEDQKAIDTPIRKGNYRRNIKKR